MPKVRALCCLCNCPLEIDGEKYNGIKFARSIKKIEAMGKHLGLSPNHMAIFKNHSEICHRHYESQNYRLDEKNVGQIRFSLFLIRDTLPNVDENDLIRLKLQRPPPVKPLPGQQSVQDLVHFFSCNTPTSSNSYSLTSATTFTNNEHQNYSRDVEPQDFDMDDIDDIDEPSCSSPGTTVDNICEDDEPEFDYSSTQMPKFLLTEGKQLLQLFKYCFSCGTTVTATPTISICGTAITIKFWCKTCKIYKKWSSQTKIENTQRYVGNVLVPSTAVITPIDFPSLSEFSKTLGLPMISWSTYNRVARRTYEVVESKWIEMQRSIIENIIKKQEKGEETCISADCQFDSRGYCASQGCETAMCSKSMLVLTGHVLERSETKNNSGAMEVEGLKRCLAELKEKGVKVKVVTTDRSVSVIAFMSKFKDILHLFDPWHLFKSLNKAYREAAKLKSAPEMKVWIGPLLNHMWHSVKVAKGDGDLCVQYILNSLIHPLGIHEWQPGRLEDVLREVHSKIPLNRGDKAKYKKNDPSTIKSQYVKDIPMTMSQCPHSYRSPDIVEENRLPIYSKVYNVILKTLTKEHIIQDMKKLSPNLTTSYLENLHSLITGKYRSKAVYYPKHHSLILTYLAYYHHNMNIFDEMNGNRYVIRKKLQKSRQRGGELVVKYVKTPPDLSWKVTFNEILLNGYAEKVELSNSVEDVEVEDVEVAEDIRIDNDFDEELVNDILDGNLPPECIGLINDPNNNSNVDEFIDE